MVDISCFRLIGSFSHSVKIVLRGNGFTDVSILSEMPRYDPTQFSVDGYHRLDPHLICLPLERGRERI